LGESSMVIEVAAIKIFSARVVRFARIGAQTKRRLDRGLCERQPRRSVIVSEEVEIVMRVGQQAISLKEGRITCDGLIEKVGRLEIERLNICVKAGGEKNIFDAIVEIECGHVGSLFLLDCGFLKRREICLKLDGF